MRRPAIAWIALVAVVLAAIVTVVLWLSRERSEHAVGPYDPFPRPAPEVQAALWALAAEEIEPFESEAAFADYVRELERIAALHAANTAHLPTPSVNYIWRRSWIHREEIAGVEPPTAIALVGDHLVVSSAGRLVSLALDRAQLEVVSALEPSAPNPSMVVRGSTVALAGELADGSVELRRLRIDEAGRLHESSRSLLDGRGTRTELSLVRVVGDRVLLLLSNDPLARAGGSFTYRMPSWREPHATGVPPSPLGVLRPIQPSGRAALRLVIGCPMLGECEVVALVIPTDAVTHVDSDAVYFFASDRRWASGPVQLPGGVIYRVPHDRGAVTAVRVAGATVQAWQVADQHLRVAVDDGSGEEVRVAAIPLNLFAPDPPEIPESSYRSMARAPTSTQPGPRCGWLVTARSRASRPCSATGDSVRRAACRGSFAS